MDTDLAPASERNYSLAGQQHQTPAGPVTVQDEDNLKHQQWQLLKLPGVVPVVGLVQSGLYAALISGCDVVTDELDITGRQGLQHKHQQILQWAEFAARHFSDISSTTQQRSTPFYCLINITNRQ